MIDPVLTAQDILAWNETTSRNWRKLLTDRPEFLTQPCDIAGAKTIAELLQHIVAVELRYAERLAELPISEYASVPFDSVDALYTTHDGAIALFRDLLNSEVKWDEVIEFPTRTGGRLRSSRKTIFFHALLHGIRHYAQLATLARQHGAAPGWPMDYLFMHMERVQ